jgi:Tol biopolymer transport system component
VATDQRALPTAEPFPAMSNQVWSPDGSQIAYLDDAGNPWLLSVKGHDQYPLNVNNGLVLEMAWSPDGKLLAIRLDGSVVIFNMEMNCG